ncbi:NAD(P)/FAD-dependent oxidoreductase [Aliikangiella sp. IMCC44359]|uniref:NAD(P)/FAD-dependent oxidoreductase n=1 Tax=Aliikangiella sp. IMCC44359 TaxID=3459125 RepID=UPI00403A878D
MNQQPDIIIVGGGIMGCATALRLAQGGMRPLILEQSELGSGASGVNAGTLSLQIKRVALMAYALKGHELWEKAGSQVGFCKTGGITLAFNEREEELLHSRMQKKIEAGAPITFLSQQQITHLEPNLTSKIKAASYCPEDGYANSSLTGNFYRTQIQQAEIHCREFCQVSHIEYDNGHYKLVTNKGLFHSKRLLLATGGWLKSTAKLLDINLPIKARVNTVSVTEKTSPLLNGVTGHATGLLTMKQKANGTILIGGGWQGKGKPKRGSGQVSLETLIPNIQLAQYTLPALNSIRILRSWTGYEANVPDFYPLAGAIPGFNNLFVLGCVRGGYTIGPYISQLMGDFILQQEPELPLFDPARFTNNIQ